MLQDTLKKLNRKRERSEDNFSTIHDKASVIAEDLGVKIQLPRLTTLSVELEGSDILSKFNHDT